jgi:hypothetical protein
MHEIEPHYNWRDDYTAEEDERSPFYEREYSEFEFTHNIYNFALHPQWDHIGSPTLFVKLLYADYELGFATIELIGEWNDCLHNDIMFLKREVIDLLMQNGIHQFILIGENVLNFHSSDESYYEEWFDEIEDGWIAFVNFQEHVLREFENAGLDYFFLSRGELEALSWRTFRPEVLFNYVKTLAQHRIGC